MDSLRARDVLEWEATPSADGVTTVDINETIQSALATIFDDGLSQLPVEDRSGIRGVVSYQFIARVLKSLGAADLTR